MSEGEYITKADVLEIVQQAIQQAATQAAEQTAQQVGQQAVETIRQVVNATLTAGPQEIGAEREFEIGKDEAWAANMKRMFDEYQHESLTDIRNLRTSTGHLRRLEVIAEKALEDALIHGKDLDKQSVELGDLAADRTWNINETDTLATILAARISEVLKQEAE